ncbi:MAG: hypothetical protein IH937_13660, partial [Acidobacteria bacterium]|nr:hypothetical protein [Acidobacteriota bacterium]
MSQATVPSSVPVLARPSSRPLPPSGLSLRSHDDRLSELGPMTAAEAQRRRSIDRIVRDYRQRLLSFIRWLAPTRTDAEDILQDVLYQFIVSFDDIRSLEN